jgi:hypothetical protein
MTRAIWQSVGAFDESYRFHLDTEWLGRLKEKSIKRIHLVEATAPINNDLSLVVRPWLANLFRYGDLQIILTRHKSPWPLVRRLPHPSSGTQTIATDPVYRLKAKTSRPVLRDGTTVSRGDRQF